LADAEGQIDADHSRSTHESDSTALRRLRGAKGKAMTKAALEELVLAHAKLARDVMISTGGSMRQRALIVDALGRHHMIVIDGEVFHGSRMRDTLLVFSLMNGGADAYLIISDVRMEAQITPAREREIDAAAARGRWLIAENPNNPEALMVIGRSREHRATAIMCYSRKPVDGGPDVIEFADPEPTLSEGEFNTAMIPNIWERVN
jgi:hypothetical protein